MACLEPTNITEDGFHTWGSRMWGYCRQNRRCPEDYSIEESKIKDYLSYTFDTDSRSLSLHTNIIIEIFFSQDIAT